MMLSNEDIEWVRLSLENERLEARIQELLEANTRLVNERREATMLRDEVRAFHRLANQSMPEKPTMPSHELAAFRLALILEEVEEVADALGYQVEATQLASIRAFVLAHPKTNGAKSLDAIVKELADIAYVVEGSFSQFGIDSQPALRAVCESNKSKVPFTKNDVGKIQKGPNYKPADMTAVLLAQGWQP